MSEESRVIDTHELYPPNPLRTTVPLRRNRLVSSSNFDESLRYQLRSCRSDQAVRLTSIARSLTFPLVTGCFKVINLVPNLPYHPNFSLSLRSPVAPIETESVTPLHCGREKSARKLAEFESSR